MNLFWMILKNELRATWRQAFAWLTPFLFFALIIFLFPIALGSNFILLKQITPAIIWIAALLAILLSLNSLFQKEADEGYLENWLLSPHSLTFIISCKLFSHWLIYVFPLILISPLLGFLLHLSAQEEGVLIITLLLGTPVLTLFGAIGSALTIGIRGHGLLLPILIMPLYVPVLIFATGAMTLVNFNQSIASEIAILSALLLVSITFIPWLVGVALRIGVDQ